MSRSGFSQCPLCSRSKPVLPISAGTGGCDFSREGRQWLQAHLPPGMGAALCLPLSRWGKIPPAWSLPFGQSQRTKRRDRRSAPSSREPRARGPRSPKRSVCGGRFHAVGLSRLRCTGLCRAQKMSPRHRNAFFLPAAARPGLPVPLSGRTGARRAVGAAGAERSPGEPRPGQGSRSAARGGRRAGALPHPL